jgi:hypothetical protein
MRQVEGALLRSTAKAGLPWDGAELLGDATWYVPTLANRRCSEFRAHQGPDREGPYRKWGMERAAFFPNDLLIPGF